MNKAYRTIWRNIESIVAAKIAAQARSRTQVCAIDCGYEVRWIDIRVSRAPEFDAWAEKDSIGRCVSESSLPRNFVGAI